MSDFNDGTIRVEGLDRLRGKVAEMAGGKDIEFKQLVLQRIALRFLALLAEYTAVKTGSYLESWRVLTMTENTVSIGTDQAMLFYIIEYGSRPHMIYGNPILHWVSPEGEDIFVTQVFHPGTNPHPHVRPTMEQVKGEMTGIFIEAAKEVFTLLNK
jgi:hypothetical protein